VIVGFSPDESEPAAVLAAPGNSVEHLADVSSRSEEK
jgi:hypothetical protein